MDAHRNRRAGPRDSSRRRYVDPDRQRLQVEYSFANPDFSMHDSDSSSSAGDDSGNQTVESMRRVVVMHDGVGKPSHVPMARFYYDSIARSPDDDEEDPDEEPDEAESAPPSNINPAVIPNAPAQAAPPVMHPIPGQTPIASAPSNVIPPAPLSPATPDSAVESEVTTDPFENQFMRISLPASELKDVSSVKKDIAHDQPDQAKPGRRASVMAGLKRAITAVRLTDHDTSADVSRANSGLAAPSELGGKKEEQRNSAPDEAGLQRRRESTAQRPRRQNLGSVGRLSTLSKTRTADGMSPVTPDGGDDSRSNLSATSAPPDGGPSAFASVDQLPPARSSMYGLGRFVSINRRRTVSQIIDGQAEEEAVPRRSSSTRNGLSRLGRMISITRRPGASMGPDLDRPERPRPRKGASLVPDLRRSRDPRMPDSRGPHHQVSPLSSSTMSITSADSPHGTSEPRGVLGSSAMRKRESRLNIRGASRLLSVGRRNDANGTDDGSIIMRMARRPGERSGATDHHEKRSQSIPRARPDGGSAVDAPHMTKPDMPRDKFSMEEVRSPVVLASGLLGEDKHIRLPVIALAEFHDPMHMNKWHIDAFTLPHNAVRKECTDLYDIICGLACRRPDNDIGEIELDKLEAWWNVAHRFLQCYFEMERRVLLPWVDSAGPQDLAVQQALKKMRSMKDRLELLLTAVNRVWSEKTYKTSGELFMLFYKSVDDFIPRMLNYFMDQEVLLPAIVKKYYTVERRDALDKDMIAAFMEDPSSRQTKSTSRHNLILLVRWIPDPKHLRAWVGQRLGVVARNSYSRWYALYETEHAGLARELKG